MNIWRYFDLLQPPCLCCGLPSGGGALLCLGCREGLPRVHRPCRRCGLPLDPHTASSLPCTDCRRQRAPIARTLAPLAYAAPADRLVQQLKFGGRLPVGRALGELLAESVPAAYRDDRLPRALVPVPLHPRRARQRGFNQAECIALTAGRRLGIPTRADAARRLVDTTAQSGLGLRERRGNLRGAFVATCALPAHVAIVDDVITSGSTMLALAETLHTAGVQRIDAWAVCRTT